MVFRPSKAPQLSTDDGKALATYIEEELEAMATSLVENITAIDLTVSYSSPLRPRAGMLIYADGVKFNPGAGEGLYVRTIAGVWSKCN